MQSKAKAEAYILANEQFVNQKYRQTYHLMAPVGWLNDPNGVNYIDGEYHVFYQHHPYSSKWGPMHWGHAVSSDCLMWEKLPVALAPDEFYDENGCFSGTSLYEAGTLYLLYTGTVLNELTQKLQQVQCLASSTDKINFSKSSMNPVIGEHNMGGKINPFEFRDPKLFKRGATYYALIVTQTKQLTGRLVLYKSKDLKEWLFHSILLEGGPEFGTMWECPDYCQMGGRDVLIVSPIEMPAQEKKYVNKASSLYFVGDINWEKGTFDLVSYNEIDHGLDFYAPQLMHTPNGILLTAWMHMWDRTNVTDELGHGWSGCMVLPRRLDIENGRLTQRPVASVYDKYETLILSRIAGKAIEPIGIIKIVEAATESFKIIFSNDLGEEIHLSYDTITKSVIFSRDRLNLRITGVESHQVSERVYYCKNTSSEIELEIFLDNSSMEVFINNGEGVMSSRIYPQNPINFVEIV